MAEADERRVERIVRNLVANAIDHADSSGVRCVWPPTARRTALTVRDHGVGLQPGQSAMVFNRFWRADPARARTTGGTGLGLAIALEDARLHGGWLQAWGTPGGGAQFRLTLPRRAGDPLTHSPLPLVPRTSARGSREHPHGPRSTARRGCPGARADSVAVWRAAPPCPSPGRSTAAADRPDRPQDAPYFNPPGPAKDGTPSAIVSGFLVAMQANPLSTSVARTFLSERARRAWKPNRGTIVYDAFEVSQTSTGATVRLADTRRLDARGGWRGGSPGRSETLDIRLVSEGGQWRIDNPPERARGADVVLRPQLRAVQPLLLRPDRADAAARPGLHPARRADRHQPGPRPARRAGSRARRGHPLGPALAHRPRPLRRRHRERRGRGARCRGRSCRSRRRARSRAVDQLAWTLRQVPGIERVRITVGGAPVPLPRRPDRRPGHQRRGVRRRRHPRRAAVGPAGRPGGRPVVERRPEPSTARWASPATPCAASP